MAKFINSILNLIKLFINKKNNQLKLKNIKIKNNTMYCEFNEILRLDGKLIKININEIANNTAIKETISSEHLFILGTAYGRYLSSKDAIKLKKIDIANNSVLFESQSEKILINIDMLLHDEDLLKKINQLDLIRILSPYIYKLGYDASSYISELDGLSKNKFKNNSNTNIVSLF